ncbi:MAG: hydrogenase expression protein, partial [Chloroflexi bacterium]|nr:hydrogenase expression protein [Chloroflexota bacterium]
ATALAELAEASGVGVEVDRTAVPLFPETAAICEALGADPWGLLASGALLIATAPDAADRILAALRHAGVRATRIGRVTEPSEGLRLLTPGGAEPLPTFQRDEVARILEA